MLNTFKSVLSLFLFAVVLFSTAYGQETIKIEKKLLEHLIQKTDTHLLLRSENGSIYALDSNRKTLYPAGYIAPDNEVFYVFEVRYLKEHLQSKNSSLSEDGDTLIFQTFGWPGCPPLCP